MTKGGALLNYTTDVPASRSMGEVTGLLVEGGARRIMTEYDDAGSVSGIAFAMETPLGRQSFLLPVEVDKVHQVLQRAPRRSHHARNREQAEKVAWRVLKDWLEAQLALIRIGMVGLDQVMLPYMEARDGRTVYELIMAGDEVPALAAPALDDDDVVDAEVVS